MDYFFLGGEDMEASENPMLVMLDEGRGNRYARMVDQKGLGEGSECLLIDMAEEVRSWGYPEGQARILKSDSEPAMLVVREALSRYLGGEITPENPP